MKKHRSTILQLSFICLSYFKKFFLPWVASIYIDLMQKLPQFLCTRLQLKSYLHIYYQHYLHHPLGHKVCTQVINKDATLQKKNIPKGIVANLAWLFRRPECIGIEKIF